MCLLVLVQRSSFFKGVINLLNIFASLFLIIIYTSKFLVMLIWCCCVIAIVSPYQWKPRYNDLGELLLNSIVHLFAPRDIGYVPIIRQDLLLPRHEVHVFFHNAWWFPRKELLVSNGFPEVCPWFPPMIGYFHMGGGSGTSCGSYFPMIGNHQELSPTINHYQYQPFLTIIKPSLTISLVD